MSIHVRKVDNYYGIWNSVECTFFNAEDLALSIQEVEEYEAEHPFPKTKYEAGESYKHYSKKDMIDDICDSTGTLIIAGTKGQADWVAEMLSQLI
jgi:hypothetical protein